MYGKQDSIALLGDASHPTLPYQAQRAAMAVEDGAVIGMLLGELQQTDLIAHSGLRQQSIRAVLALYQQIRKSRTAVNVLGAVKARKFYHLPDGNWQKERDDIIFHLDHSDREASCKWNWGDTKYQKDLLGFDVLADAHEQFEKWRMGRSDM